jgi:hypothetical protein
LDSKINAIVQRHGAFWRRESVDRPILSIQVFDPLASKHIPLSNVVWGDKESGERLSVRERGGEQATPSLAEFLGQLRELDAVA